MSFQTSVEVNKVEVLSAPINYADNQPETNDQAETINSTPLPQPTPQQEYIFSLLIFNERGAQVNCQQQEILKRLSSQKITLGDKTVQNLKDTYQELKKLYTDIAFEQLSSNRNKDQIVIVIEKIKDRKLSEILGNHTFWTLQISVQGRKV